GRVVCCALLFFFQAEDGIRDLIVTGVQTCALPICLELEVSEADEARDAYRRALELDPHHADAHVNLGRLLVEADRAEEAETHFRAAVVDHPAHATAWFNLGIALEDRRRPNDAVKAYEQAIVADRRLADAYFNLARLYEQAGKRAAALRNLSKYRLMTDR